MAQVVSKEQEYLEAIHKFAAYVNHDEMVIGIFATVEDSLVANKSKALKKLQSLFKWKIQMVIK